ncbi:CTP:molybdopterin cytidylyltransferase MocA [Yoonia maritima]|uniref:CTP:molybdopterin cytidylyltransferase MocA n=1 Tax=Yoonia maritima TaxID=1435347 RepID=A0A2T0VUT5_9RHOB|nr:nucleotidyltransferase family protein [Yoonia maritima]PRY75033.1 CTP:molybdopterin cytidylyltransferase MocA [Yoonia maritima]
MIINNIDCPTLILAAGSSSRMNGRDKLNEVVDGEPLLRTQCKKAIATQQHVYVALPSADHPRAALLSGLDVTLLAIPQATEGIGATLRESVARLAPCSKFMIILADLVSLQTSDLVHMLCAVEEHPNHLIWRGATHEGNPGHPVVFDNALRSEFLHLSGDNGAAPIIKKHRDQMRLVPLGKQALLDLDTPKDWADWRAGTKT